uniref:Uncharacterized protein n=1 Tax=Avena sativa TaxID=4498 RepID=A0ACD5YXU5_AVESA
MISPLSRPMLLLLVTIVAHCVLASASGVNPTSGFVKVDLTDGNFQVQSPYNVPESQRFRYSHGVRQFWVHDTDKPFNTATHTNPRTEVRLRGHDYSSGVWQFQGYGYVLSGTSGVSVMQIHNEEGA